MPLLPINLDEMQAFYDMALSQDNRKKDESDESKRNRSLDSRLRGNDKENEEDVIFEPGLEEVLDFVVTHYVSVKIYQALLETKASEHSARMLAMQTATDNAKELVSDLTLSYNQTRQAGITNELLEITSALAALE